MPIASPIGFLDVTNATLRSSQVEATSRLTVANTAATMNFSVGTKFHIDATSVDPVIVSGNVVATGIKIGNLAINPTFDLGAVSNVGNTTSNIIQFANAATGFVTSSNIEIGGNISFTSNTQVKVDSNVVAEYTGPHGREPKEMPLKKYPEISFDASKLDGNDSTNTYTQAGYTVTASTQYAVSYAAYHTFNDVLQDIEAGAAGVLWTSAVSTYPASGGFYVGTTNGIGTTYGEFVKLELPYKIKPKEVRIFPRTYQGGGAGNAQSPAQFKIFGSNDNFSSEIVELYHQNTDWVNNGTWGVFDISHTTHFKHFGIVFTKTNGSTIVGVQEIEYYGREEPAPPGDSSLDTTLKSTFNSVRSNNYVMYFDGKDPASGNVPKYLVSGSAKSITPNNIVFDATNNCWTLNGSTQSNVTTGSLGLVGDAPHTVSMWINASNLDANTLTQQLFSIGSGYSKEIVRVDDTQISANTWHNVTYAYQGECGTHNHKMTYVDGRKVADEKVEDTFGVYPPFPMTGYKTGGYCVSASSQYDTDYNPWEAFDNITGSSTGGPYYGYWSSTSGAFNTGSPFASTRSGAPYVTNVGGTSYTGEWLQIELPHKLKVDSINYQPRNTAGMARTGIVAGSNNDTTWEKIFTYQDITAANVTATTPLTPNSSISISAFKYIRIIITHGNGHEYAGAQDVQIYGHKEGDLTRFPEPTRVLKYPHILTKNGTGDGYTSATSAPGYGKRGYVIKASSSIGSYPPYAAFNGETHVATGTTWIGGYNSYGTSAGGSGAGGYKTSGAMNLKTNLGTGGSATSNGEWLYIEMPHKIKVTSTKIVSNDGVGYPPDYLIIYGTNDPSSSGGWVVVDDTYDNSSSGVPNNATGKTWAVSTASSPVAYKYFALVIVKINSSAALSHAIVSDWQLIGTQENTGTHAIVGGPFAGKVANFRVYDQYLGDERIQEIYDAQKDAFGHKKSSMTLYKGRVGVGTTEPSCALTVLDEPNAVVKFPSSNLSADYSFIEGEGCIKISSAGSSGSSGSSGGGGYGGGGGGGGGSSGSGFSAFDGLTSTCWSSTPTRNTRLSEEVDFGAWLKMETPESTSLKKAEIESKPDWNQVGATFQGVGVGHNLGDTVACNKDGTRIAIAETATGGTITAANDGRVRIYDWNGSAWTQIGQNLTGAQSDYYGVGNMGFSDDGHRFITSSPNDGTAGGAAPNAGVVEVYYLVGATWTILGTPFTSSDSAAQVGKSCAISGDGNTIAFVEYQYDDASIGSNTGRTRVFTWNGTTWVQKGLDMIGDVTGDGMGRVMEMTSDGNYVIIGNYSAGSNNGKVWIYAWNGSAWGKRGNTLVGTGADLLGFDVTISDDANTIAIGENHNDDKGTEAGAVEIRTWNGSAYVLTQTLYDAEETTGRFGSGVALSGDGTRLVAVTTNSPGDSASAHGRARVFEYYGGSWQLRQPFTSIGAQGNAGTDTSGSALGQEDGLAVSRDGSVIVVGLKNDDTGGNANSGQAKVFSMPSNIKSIWGSNDDVNWTKITTGNETFRGDDRLEFKNLDNPNYYKYHAIVADAFTQLKEVKLFGVRKQGSSTLHDGTLTLTKKVTAPQLESTGIINMKGDYTEIRANSNVVTCFDRSKKLMKFPRVDLTGYSQDGYVVTDSDTHYGTAGWKAFAPFDNSVLYWAAGSGIYSTTSGAAGGVYNTSHASAKRLSPTTDYGEYLILELPHKIILSSVYISARQSHVFKAPGNFKIYGSNNNSDWYTLLTVTGATPSYRVGNYYPCVSDVTPYKYLAIVVSKASGGSAFVPGDNSPSTIDAMMIAEISYFGTPETDPEAHGVDVVIKSLPNVPNTDSLEVYYDAKNYSGSGDVQDETTNNRDAEMNATFDNGEIKAFNFTGSYTSNVTTSDHGLGTGDVTYTISYWFKRTRKVNNYDYTYMMGNGGSTGQASLMWILNNQLHLDHWGTATVYKELIQDNRWYHVAVGHKGGNAVTNDFLFVDGQNVGVGISSAATFNLQGSKLTLGTSHSTANEFLKGSIANFRIFNRALTSDEIYQLYAYQKEYFGHGNLGMTLKAGRLDVRGDIRTSGLVNNAGMHWFIGTPTASSGNVVYTASGGNWFSSTASSTIFGTVLRSENSAPHDAWNSTTGFFTAPEDGLYLIDLGLFVNAVHAGRWGRFDLQYTDGSIKEGQYTFYTANMTADDTFGYSKTVYMKTGEKFRFYTEAGTATLFLSAGPPGHATMNIYKIS